MLIKNLAVNCITAVFTLALSTLAQAEVLVILPETGAMANAADSIKRGLIQANHQAGNPYTFNFINLHQHQLSDVLKQQVKPSTQLVIGPLDKQNVEQLIHLQPKVKTLALNQVNSQHQNVYQFALSKEEDALALTKRMQADGIDQVIVLREVQTAAQTQSFYDAMYQLWGDKMQTQEKLPMFKKKSLGILLLGSGKWVSEQKIPNKNIYTLPFAIEEQYPIPQGMIYCDTPAIYTQQWSDVVDAYKQKPVILPFQRLIAFGGDAWQIADVIQKRQNNEMIEFQGRTGHILIADHIISRQPQCFQSDGKVQKVL